MNSIMFRQQKAAARRLLVSFSVSIVAGSTCPAQMAETPSEMVAIVSPKYPKDSRGEVVYERQGKSQMDQPVVPGILAGPAIIHAPHPKTFREAHATGEVKIDYIIAKDGTPIDPVVISSPGSDSTVSALQILKKYHFRAATLDGRAIASLSEIVIQLGDH